MSAVLLLLLLQAKNHRRRIINRNSLSEFAYILKEGGLLYIVTDVKELHDWQVAHLEAHPVLFRACLLATPRLTPACTVPCCFQTDGCFSSLSLGPVC